MKTRILLVWVAGLWAMAVAGQGIKCEDSFKSLEANVKAGEYGTATVILDGLRKDCPKYGVKLYTLGNTALRYNMETARTDGDKELTTTGLITFYDEWEKNFPGTGGVQKKALLLKEKSLAKDEEIFKLLDGAFTTHKNSFIDYNVLELYFNLYLDRYKAGDKNITQDGFIAKFSDIVGQAAYAQSFIQKRNPAP
jgi:hypothetical protein